MQVEGLVPEGAPQALDEDVVQAPAPAVHGDGTADVFEGSGELQAGELAALVGVEDLMAAVALQGFSEASTQKRASRVLESRQESRSDSKIWPTLRLYEGPERVAENGSRSSLPPRPFRSPGSPNTVRPTVHEWW